MYLLEYKSVLINKRLVDVQSLSNTPKRLILSNLRVTRLSVLGTAIAFFNGKGSNLEKESN